MGYGGHQLRLKCAQVHHQSPAGTFARVPGMCLHWSPTPPGPRYNTSRRRSFTSIQTVHAHTLPLAGWCPLDTLGENEDEKRNEDEMKVKLR